jgi:hypothetical protein
MDFKEFLAALSADWVSLMSGIASVVLTVISVARRWQSIPRWALWVAAAICFFLASARVWTTEHRARAENWNYYELATGHTAMVTAPDELTRVLLRITN